MEEPINLEHVYASLLAIEKTSIITAKILKKMLELLQETTALEGTSVTNTFTLQTGRKVTKIDFVEAKHDGTPSNVTFDVPLKPVAVLKISNLGPGRVFYSTNKGLSQTEAAEEVLVGESEYVKLKKRAIKHLNIVANDQQAKVRVTAWV